MPGLRRIIVGGLSALLALGVGLIALDLIFPPPLHNVGATSLVVADRGGRTLRAFSVEDGRWRLAADLDRVDPRFVDALIAMEDKRFFAHAGVDILALSRAAKSNLASGRVISGGSTLSMQTARLLEPRERTLSAKIFQIARATQLERRMSKREILELYLTLAPYGGNLEGVRAASWAYFNREPEQLTWDQIALLIALPQSPEARRPDLRPEAARLARARVLDRLVDAGLVDRQRAGEAKAAAISERQAFPALAWHAAEGLNNRSAAQADNVNTLRSTIDIGAQKQVANTLRQSINAEQHDIQFAALVVEIETRAVRAAVGSAGRDRPGGWIDLTNRHRSPGSTLKPFIYALAFDDGLAAGHTRVSDLPRRFGTYQPDNFEGVFHGEVSIAEALQYSLNVPAVMTLDVVGPDRFAATLDAAGAPPLIPQRADDHAGLAVALGGWGLTVRDIATLYAALGDGGMVRPLVWLESETQAAPDGRRLMSSETATEILEILRTAPAPKGRAPAALTRGGPNVAFKTGTSYGFRDAWAAGVAGGHVVVVWTGRADGAPSSRRTGRDAALPVLFDVFDALSALGLLEEDRSGVAAVPERTPSSGPLTQLERNDAAPHILFPPDGTEVLAEHGGEGGVRPFVLAGRGAGRLRWYVDGEPAPTDEMGAPLWIPMKPGFYAIAAVDPEGRSTTSLVRVRMADNGRVGSAQL